MTNSAHDLSITRIRTTRTISSHTADGSAVLLIAAAHIEWIIPGPTLPTMMLGMLLALTCVAWICWIVSWCTYRLLLALKDLADQQRADYYLELLGGRSEPPDGKTQRHLRSLK